MCQSMRDGRIPSSTALIKSVLLVGNSAQAQVKAVPKPEAPTFDWGSLPLRTPQACNDQPLGASDWTSNPWSWPTTLSEWSSPPADKVIMFVFVVIPYKQLAWFR